MCKNQVATFFYADHQQPFRKTINRNNIHCWHNFYRWSSKELSRFHSESNFYVFLDDVLHHYYQPRSKRSRHPNNHLKKVAVPRCLREYVIWLYHDSLAGGAHLGFEHTYRAIQLKYYWPAMYQNIADYVRSCRECQLSKKHIMLPHYSHQCQLKTDFPESTCTSLAHLPKRQRAINIYFLLWILSANCQRLFHQEPKIPLR